MIAVVTTDDAYSVSVACSDMIAIVMVAFVIVIVVAILAVDFIDVIVVLALFMIIMNKETKISVF